jgi:post-segregation antitoxin (ccd killing protein)
VPRPAADPVHAVTEAASNVYSMRMARVNITMPEDLYSQAKQAGLNVSQLAQQAIAVELARMAKVAALDRYLAELESELGPTSDAERADAKAWADQVLGQTSTRRSA